MSSVIVPTLCNLAGGGTRRRARRYLHRERRGARKFRGDKATVGHSSGMCSEPDKLDIDITG
ncbi:hypothetical protein J6590_034407 [Homalodisca vitripennis]|nr:hypothetical protein J6590_034407 [Homalodisca vitripennis]